MKIAYLVENEEEFRFIRIEKNLKHLARKHYTDVTNLGYGDGRLVYMADNWCSYTAYLSYIDTNYELIRVKNLMRAQKLLNLLPDTKL